MKVLLVSFAIICAVGSVLAADCELHLYSLQTNIEGRGHLGDFTAIGIAESAEPLEVISDSATTATDCYRAALQFSKDEGFPQFVEWTLASKNRIITKGRVDEASPEEPKTGDRRRYRPGMNFPRNCLPCFLYYLNTAGPVTDGAAFAHVVRSGQECTEKAQSALDDVDKDAEQASIVGVLAIWGKGVNVVPLNWHQKKIYRQTEVAGNTVK